MKSSEDRRYLRLAAHARKQADRIENRDARSMMMEVADSWERLGHLEETDLERKPGRASREP